MSVKKCKDFLKFKPYLIGIYNSVNGDETAFKNTLQELLTPQAIINAWNSISSGQVEKPEPEIAIHNVRVIDRSKMTIGKDDPSVEFVYSFSTPLERQKIENKVVQAIIKRTLYNSDTKESINSTELINGYSQLNRNLFEYQKDLLNNIRKFIGFNAIEQGIDDLTDDSWNQSIQETFEKFLTYQNDNSRQYKNAKLNYIVLKCFGEIISRNCGFLGFNYVDKNANVLDRFKFNGATVQHYTGSIGSTETANLTDQVSDIASVLLDSIPKVNGNVNIPNTSIGILGFQNVVTKIKNAIFYSSNSELKQYRKSLLNGDSAEYAEMINTFLVEQNANRIPSKYIITDVTTLNGMYTHIFNNDKMDNSIKNIFKRMFLQSCNNQFMCYAVDPSTKEFTLKSLEQVAVDNEARRFYDVIKCAALMLMNKEVKPYTIKDNIINIDDKIKIKYTKKAFSFTTTIESGEEFLSDAIQTILNYTSYTEYDDVVKLLSPSGKINNTSINYIENSRDKIFTDLIGIVITSVESSNKNLQKLTDSLQSYWGRYRAVGKINSTILGTDIKNVIKNLEGNSIPAFNLPHLTWRLQEHVQTMLEDDSRNSIANSKSNLLKKPKGVKLEQAFIRNVAKYNNTTKSASQMTVSEVMYLSIFQDYWKNLISDESLMFQPTTFSDKSQQFIHVFDISEDFVIDGVTYNLKSLLKRKEFSKIETIIRKLRANKYTQLKDNVLSDYNFVFDENLKSFEDLNNFLKGKTQQEIRQAFSDKGKVAYDEIHFTKTGKGLFVNETLQNFYETFTNEELFKKRISEQKARFVQQLKLENFIVPEQLVAGLDSDWIDVYGHVILEKEGKLNPILEGYFLSDILLSGQVQDLLVGDSFAHPSKYASKNYGTKDPNYLIYSEADRLIAQNKRAVIHGATYHMLLQKPDGVGATVKAAVMDDITVDIQTITGSRDSEFKAMDGSALASALFTRLMNNSLEDARVGADMKTIFHSFVPEYGLQQLCKWATFAITNERRRMGYGSSVSAEKLHRKMHSLPITTSWDGIVNLITTNWNNKLESEIILFQNPEQLTDYYRLTKIEYENGVFEKHFTKFENGQSVGEEFVRYVDTDVVGKSLYTIESLFGGAFNYKYQNGEIVASETNLDVLEDIIKHFPEIKQNLIGFMINKSSMKVGTGNINSSERFNNDEELMTIELSTQFGGLQMDAEHELEDSHLNETTQLVSALEQLGYSHDIVSEIYKDIGKVAYDAIQDLANASDTYSEDPDKLYKILGKALIESFKSNDRDTLGLAQSFIQIAQSYINESTIKYRLPFSSNQINGIFVSTINSRLTSSGIRRKYSGIISVLTPSYNVMQYYKFKDQTYTYDQLGHLIKNTIVNLPENWKISDYTHIPDGTNAEEIINNPFIIPINQWESLEFGDTILYIDKNKQYGYKRVESFADWDFIRQNAVRTWKHLLQPRNLKGQDVYFTVLDNITDVSYRYNVYDIPAIRAINYLGQIDKKISELESYKIDVIKSVLQIENIETIPISKLKSDLQKLIQVELDNLKVGNTFNNTFTILKVDFQPAQIGMGKQNAKKFLLRKGDRLSDINNSDFFYQRLKQYYDYDGILNSELYDFVIFDEDRQPLFIQVGDKSQFNEIFDKLTPSTDFQFVEDDIYYKNKKLGKRNSNFDYKSVINENGDVINIVRVNNWDDLNKFKNHSRFGLYSYNFNERNLNSLHKYLYKDNATPKLWIKDYRGQWVKQKEDTILHLTKIQALNANLQYAWNNRLIDLSKEMFDSWQVQTQMIGTRIPSQAQQSFMPIELAFITDSEINDVYVPTFQTYVEGSDFDIDKLFIIGWDVSNDGKIITGSKLSEQYKPGLVLRLPLPTKRIFESDKKGTIQEIINPIANQEEYIELLNQILRSNNSVISFDPTVSDAFVERVLNDLKIHNNTYLDESTKTSVLKNKVVAGMHRVVKDPRNFISASLPVDDAMNKLKEYAKLSDAGVASKFISTDNPFSKFMMQIENMVGKNVIGIGATGQKSFFAITYVYNQMVRDAISQNDITLLDKILFQDPMTKKLTTIVNLNVEPLQNMNDFVVTIAPKNLVEIGAVTTDELGNKIFSPKKFVEWVKQNSWNFDGATNISAIISAATDNAKELILKKLNCDQNFAGIYCYLTLIGHDFDDIASKMIQSNVGFLSKISSSNIFLPVTSKIRFENAAKFLQGVDFLPFVFKSDIAYLLEKSGFVKDFYEIEDLQKIFDLTEDQIDELASKIEITKHSSYFDDSGFDFEQMWSDDQIWDDYSDYSETSDEQETQWSSSEPGSAENVLLFLKYLKFRKQYVDKNAIDTKLIDNLIKWKEHADELKILGSILKINQGLANKKYDMYKYIASIENYINKQIKQDQTIPNFNFIEFLSNDNYRNNWIDIYENNFKKSINILDVVSRSPHFKEMLNILKISQQILNQSAIKNKAVSQVVANIVKKPGTLTPQQYSKLDNCISDLLVYAWLNSRNYTITLPAGTEVLNPGTQQYTVLTKDTNRPLVGVYNLATFKHFVESILVPQLKSDINLASNSFVQMLTGGSKENYQRNRQISIFAKLNIDLTNITTPKIQNIFEQIVADFNKIATQKYYGWNLGDIFYLYNLLVNKDSFGANSMTRLFEQLVTSGTVSNLVNDFNNQLSIWDKFGLPLDEITQKSNIDYDDFVKDVLFNIATPDSKWLLDVELKNNHVGEVAVDTLHSDVTFNFPHIAKSINKDSAIKENQDIKTRIHKESRSYELITTGKIGSSNIVGNFVEYVKRTYPQIQIEYMDEEEILANPTTNGFIKDGITYINPNVGLHATLHEIAHIVLAVLKQNSPNDYYKLVNKIVDSDVYTRIVEHSDLYSHLTGDDVKEEALVSEFTNYFAGKISKHWEDSIEQVSPGLILQNLFSINPSVNSELIQLLSKNDFTLLNGILNESVLKSDKDKLQSILINNQKVLTLKNNWIEDGTIEANCK